MHSVERRGERGGPAVPRAITLPRRGPVEYLFEQQEHQRELRQIPEKGRDVKCPWLQAAAQPIIDGERGGDDRTVYPMGRQQAERSRVGEESREVRQSPD